MLKKYRSKIILSSLIVLLPALFGAIMWNELPDTMTTHWGADGAADGFSSKAFAVFGLPAILLLLHFLCLLFTLMDRKQREQTPKALEIIFWIIPCVSFLSNAVIYGTAWGWELELTLFIPGLLGVMFILIGNYLPKVKQNQTLGIRIPWTLNNEENWNRTHRLGGKVWVAGGILMLLSVFLPLTAMVNTTVCVTAAMLLIPVAYSFGIYKRHQKQGVVYAAAPKSRAETMTARITAVVVTVFLIGVAVLMFTGGIELHWDESSLKINATYWPDLEIAYSQIDTIAYRTDLDTGVRTNGFGSAKLSLGVFQNQEFGAYTLYAYTGAKAFVVLTSGEKTLVIGMREAQDTRAIYDALLQKTGA